MKSNVLYILLGVATVLFSCSTSRHTSRPVDANLSSIDPGRYDESWWNRAPYRLVQTNLRETDATMDVDAYVQSMVNASASVVLINVGGIVANYPTKLTYQYRNPFMKGDLVGDLIKGLHAKGIRVIGRFDFSKINETLAAKKPECYTYRRQGRTSITTARFIPVRTAGTSSNTEWKYSKKPLPLTLLMESSLT